MKDIRIVVLMLSTVIGVIVFADRKPFAAGASEGLVLASRLPGGGAGGQSEGAALSADGRFVAFESSAYALIPGSSYSLLPEIYVYDRATGFISRESVTQAGIAADYFAQKPAISDSGRYIAFWSLARNLAPGGSINSIYLRDRESGTTARIDHPDPGQHLSDRPTISADGRFVAYTSFAAFPLSGEDALTYDVWSGTTTKDNVAPDGTRIPLSSWPLSVSGDGRYLAFTALQPRSAYAGVYLRDHARGTTTLESGGAPNSAGQAPSISNDGRFIAYSSSSRAIYIQDRSLGRTGLITSDLYADVPKLSSDGRFVSYLTRGASGPVRCDIYDTLSGSFQTVGQVVDCSRVVAGVIAFSTERQLAADDTNGNRDVYIAPVMFPSTSPTNLSYTLIGSTLTLNWTAPASFSPRTYFIEAGSSPGGTNVAHFSTGTNAPSFSTLITDNATYYVRVLASNGLFSGDPSNEIAVVLSNCTLPSPPANLIATTVGAAVTLTWIPGVGASSYRLEVGSASGASNLVVRDLGTQATMLTTTGVASGAYFVRIRSTNACGASIPSNEVLVLI